jgi:carboxyvinyl-carboxyphosphonate phosphorylmutase
MLSDARIVRAPGAYDALSAKLIQQAGFDAVYMTGAGVTISLLGGPDVGLTTMTEMVEQARRIVAATDLPVIADADTGYGNVLNVIRTVREFERAGVAAIHLEDQVAPKKCGHFEGKQLISAEEMAGKVRAALEARRDPDFVLIARVDARAGFGIQEAIRRGRLYREAGADVIFIEAPASVDELRLVGKSFDCPLLVNMVEGGKTPLRPAAELEALGFRIVIFPGSLYRAAVPAMLRVLEEIRTRGTSDGMQDRMLSFADRNRITGLADVYELERRFGPRSPTGEPAESP